MQRFTTASSENLTTDRLGDYLDGVASALAHRPALVHLAPAWSALLARCDDSEARKKQARRRLNRARVGYWVADGDFDAAVKALSTETYHLAGKDASAEPYASTFGLQTAEEVVRYGEEKATSFGRTTTKLAPNILAVIESDAARATVETLLGTLGRETTTLTAAGDAREDAITALAAFDLERRQLLRDTIALIADTEVGILTVHRGRRDLVDRVLALDFDTDGSKPKKTAPPTPA